MEEEEGYFHHTWPDVMVTLIKCALAAWVVYLWLR